MNFKEEIAELISKVTKQKIDSSLISIPPNPEMGDYAFPCFSIAKGDSPNKIASDLANQIKSKFLESVKSEGPYLNFKVDDDEYAKTIINNKISFDKTNKKIMVEFSQPNTHKEFHVGHLRNACLGDSMVRILRFTGNKVTPVNYIGDIGTHVAKTLWALDKFHKDDKIPSNKGKFLGQVYLEANTKINENESFKEDVSKVLQELESRVSAVTKKWKETREWSLNEFANIYKDLGINFDKYYFESEEEESGKKIALELLKKGIAEKSDGAIIVNLEKYNLGVALVLKTDGTTIYLTKDLSLGQKKFKEYGLDESIYVIDSRQSLHMQQVFKILELMGFKKKMVHVSYEFVSTKDGPISSRKGNTYLYEELKERLVKKLVDETKKRHSDWSDKKISDSANKVTLSALKFGMLKIENNKEIIFEEDKWLDMEGETGPYILYTYARLSSVLRKAKSEKANYKNLCTIEDKKILRVIEQTKQVIDESVRNYKPSLIARHLIDLCQKTNEYYHKHNILNEKDDIKNARLKLFGKIREIIKNNLELLGIETLEEM